MTPIERMARAICREEHILHFGEEIWRRGELDKKVNQFWREHVPAARAALSAIEEPSDEMESAARWALFKWREKSGDPQAEAPPGEKHRIRYRAMIMAALEEGP